MKIHTEVQGSPEWLALRGDFKTASEAPAMMNCSKQIKRNELLFAKKTGLDRDVHWWVQKFLFDAGHETEALARVVLEEKLGEDLFPVVCSEGDLLASMDGMDMLETFGFEHKMWNEELAAAVRAGDLDPHYYWQLEQQILVTGVEKIIFVCSDGTPDNWEQMDYYAVPGRAEQLLAGWKQFDEDLASYVHVEDPIAPVGKAPDELPALRIELTGMVTASNLKVFEETAMAVIGAVKTDLQTDQDFADAKKAVKWCSDVEAALEDAKKRALSQTESIEELFKAIDRVKAYARDTRLAVDKRVKSQEVSIKVAIKAKAEAAFTDHIATINKTLGRLVMPSVATDFAGAMKNKRTLASLRDAVDSELARAKIEANRVADCIRINLESLNTLAGNHKFLFADAQQIILKENDDLVALIKVRIGDHEKAEADKREKERLDEEAEAQRILDEAKAAEDATKSEVATPVADPVPAEKPVSAPAAAAQPVSPAPTRSAPTAIRPQTQIRRVTVVVQAPLEAIRIGMEAFGGTVVFTAEGDHSDLIESAA